MMYNCRYLDQKSFELLQKGLLQVFNSLREKNPQWKVDFSNRNFSGLNLRQANLENVNFQGSKMKMSCLSGVNMQGCDLRGVDFTQANLSGADIRHTKIDKDTIFIDANVANIRADDIEQIIKRVENSAAFVKQQIESM